jgi:hypothetical protein
MAVLSLGPVSAAVYGVLSGDSTLSTAVGGRIYDDVRQGAIFPYVWYEAREREARGFGTGTLPEVEVRVHVFSTYRGSKEAQDILDRVIVLLKDSAVTVAGFAHCGRVLYEEAVLLPDEDVNGVKVREIVGLFRLWVEA